MAVKDYIKRLLFGITVPQEYVCLSHDKISDPLIVTMGGKLDSRCIDVTASHIFLGYKPVIIGLPLTNPRDIEWMQRQDFVCFSFSRRGGATLKNKYGYYVDSKAVATLVLAKTTDHFSQFDSQFFIFQGVHGRHNFLSRFHQFSNRLLRLFKQKKSSNINLDNNLEDQVRISYAVPRCIAVISVGQDDRINMFPTDLHGKLSENYYVSSLRIGGKANQQVTGSRRIALSFVRAKDYKEIYALGKNHMQDYQTINTFDVSARRSTNFGIPVPNSSTYIMELQQIDSFDLGIHRIHLYKIISEESVVDEGMLMHVHQYYVEWRKAENLKTEMLLR